MNVLILPEIFGLGTSCAESLLSVVLRTSRHYGVTPLRLTRLAVGVGRTGKSALITKNRVNGCISCNDTTRWLVSGLEALSGRTDVISTTLLKLRPVFGPTAHGVVSRKHRICSLCQNPTNENRYGLFANQLKHVVECPLHGVPLLENCLECGSLFSNRYSPMQDRCLSCSTPLWIQLGEASKHSKYAKWCQRQVLDLVGFASNPATSVPDSWSELYCRALTGLSQSMDRRYSRTERLFVADRAVHTIKSSGALPGLDTLLRVAAIQATSLVELIQSPVECSSHRLLDIGGAKDAIRGRRNHPIEQWKTVGQALLDLLKTPDSVMLPSKRAILRQTGLSVSGLWQHDAVLAVRYEQERARRNKLAGFQTKTCALEWATALVRSRQERGQSVHIRRDGAELMKQKGVSKHTAERALNAAAASLRVFGQLGLPPSPRPV